MREVSLILGGVRSGKSRYAEELIRDRPQPWTYIATAEGLDDEMRARIARHRADRGAGWTTIEEPLALADALRAHAGTAVLVDCLTLWLTNLMIAGHCAESAVDDLVAALAASRGAVVLVSNEVGLGIVPDNELARAFRDEAGRMHQRVASIADRVILMVAGLPLTVKEPAR